MDRDREGGRCLPGVASRTYHRPMPHPQMFDDADSVLARIREIALALPAADGRGGPADSADFADFRRCLSNVSYMDDPVLRDANGPQKTVC